MPDQEHIEQHGNAQTGIVSSSMLEAAKVAESKAWHKLQLEERRIGDSISELLAELDGIRDNWADKFGEVKRLSKLHSPNTEVRDASPHATNNSEG